MIDTLCIPLAAVTDAGVEVDARASEAELAPAGAPPLALETVHVAGRIRRLDAEYLFQGVVRGAYRRVCDRCLEPVEQAFAYEVAWLFEQAGEGAAADDVNDADALDEAAAGGAVVVQGPEADLAALVWEELALNLPTKCVCKADCAGLCAGCGANLNQETCSCSKRREPKHSGLAGLAELFPGLPPAPPEDAHGAGSETKNG